MYISSDLNRCERLGKVNKLRKVILSVITGHVKTAEEIYKHEKITQSDWETRTDLQGNV